MSKLAPMTPRARKAWLSLFVLIFLAVFLLVALTATITTFIVPEAYASTAKIKIEGVTNPPMTNSSVATAYGGGYFVATDMEIIQSERILDQVIERLDLNAAWARKFNSLTKLKNSESRGLLKRMIELRPVRNTSLIAITGYSDDREEAARIANTIAEVFVDYLSRQREQFEAGTASEYKKLTEELKTELAKKTEDPATVDAKITEIIERAGKIYATINAGREFESAQIIEHSVVPYRPIRPNKPLNIAMGMIIGAGAGLVLGGVVVFLGIVLRKPVPAAPGEKPPATQ